MKRFAPAADRNKSFILEVLERILPSKGNVLEVASGSGQHTVFFAESFLGLNWLPSDLSQENVDSINEYAKESGLTNLKPALILDATQNDWQQKITRCNAGESETKINAIISINMIHIAPWAACVGLFEMGSKLLDADEFLYLYGPYIIAGKQTAQSNSDFDQQLKSNNQEWGIRLLEDVVELAEANGFLLHGIITMPANNFSVVFKKAAETL